jgi:hypothetical protein
MRSQAEDLHLVRPSAVEGANHRTVDKYKRVRARGRGPKFPQRPQADVLSDSIPLFFIAATELAFGSRVRRRGERAEFFSSRTRPCVSLRKTVAQADARLRFSPSD